MYTPPDGRKKRQKKKKVTIILVRHEGSLVTEEVGIPSGLFPVRSASGMSQEKGEASTYQGGFSGEPVIE